MGERPTVRFKIEDCGELPEVNLGSEQAAALGGTEIFVLFSQNWAAVKKKRKHFKNNATNDMHRYSHESECKQISLRVLHQDR